MTHLYAFAHNLIGFKTSTLRVRIERIAHGNVFVRTADLTDAGTPLVLNLDQIELEETETVCRHRDGFVEFSGDF